MCTVSVVSYNGKTIITSNRDEQVVRPSAIEPKNYVINNKNVIFPKDAKAGGTWYAVSEDGTVLVLLNGAAEKHQLKSSYRKSRGLIVLDLISSSSVLKAWETIDLEGIEPFTLVLFSNQKLHQLRWNEVEKDTTLLNANQPHIWSSSTLYSNEVRQERATWFTTFLNQNTEISPQDMLHFHRYTESENQQHGLVINRGDALKTLSITQTVIEANKVVLSHYDLQQQKEFINSFIII